jgi:hypothetical protein
MHKMLQRVFVNITASLYPAALETIPDIGDGDIHEKVRSAGLVGAQAQHDYTLTTCLERKAWTEKEAGSPA